MKKINKILMVSLLTLGVGASVAMMNNHKDVIVAEAASIGDDDATKEGKVFYVAKEKNWSDSQAWYQILVHAFGNDDESSWGDNEPAMDYIGDYNVESKDYYVYRYKLVSAKSTTVTLHTNTKYGTAQTKNVTLPSNTSNIILNLKNAISYDDTSYAWMSDFYEIETKASLTMSYSKDVDGNYSFENVGLRFGYDSINDQLKSNSSYKVSLQSKCDSEYITSDFNQENSQKESQKAKVFMMDKIFPNDYYTKTVTARLVITAGNTTLTMNEKSFSVKSLATYYVDHAAELELSESEVAAVTALKNL